MENYRVMGIIGRGGFAEVKAALDRNGVEVAVKRVYCPQVCEWVTMGGKGVPMEVACLEMLHGVSGIPHLIDHFGEGDYYYLVMERPQGAVDLVDYLDQRGALSEDEARRVFRQLLTILWNVREAGLVHRDVKLENILVNPDTLDTYLIDFGLASEVINRPLHTFRGTREYAPYEFVKTKRFYTDDAEVWSLGVLLYGMVAGRLPFQSIEEVLVRKPEAPRGVSKGLRRLLRQTLCRDPDGRITLNQMVVSPWVRGGDKLFIEIN